MKRSALIFVMVISVLCLALGVSVHAQEFDAEKAYRDYQYQQTNYLNAEAEYNDSKTFYIKNPTLQLKENLREKTLTLLKSRDQLMVVYLTALRSKITETTGLTTEEKLSIFSRIDPEIAWYQLHIVNYLDNDEADTLFIKSDESKKRHGSSTIQIVYDLLFNISLSQEIGLKNDHQIVYTDIKNYIDEQVSLGKLKIDPFNRWINDTNSVLNTLNENETLAKNTIPSTSGKSTNIGKTYNNSVQLLNGSVEPLIRLNNYLTEMLTYIKSQPL